MYVCVCVCVCMCVHVRVSCPSLASFIWAVGRENLERIQGCRAVLGPLQQG